MSPRCLPVWRECMKRVWDTDDLIEHWTLTPEDLALLGAKTGHNRLGCALLLKYLHLEGRFPQHKHEAPPAVGHP